MLNFNEIKEKASQMGPILVGGVVVLPVAGLLMALSVLTPASMHLGLLGAVADTLFSNLALVFAVVVAAGFSCDKQGGFAGVLVYLLSNKVISYTLGITYEMAEAGGQYTHSMGVDTLNMGVFGGMICGAVGAWVYNKYHAMELIAVLGFFKGKRLVPVMSVFISIPLGFALALTWPIVQGGISGASSLINNDVPTWLSTFLMGFGERALIPFGLHHLWYSPFWFMLGDYTNAAGQLVHGDQTITMAMLSDGVKDFRSPTYNNAGFFMQGEYPLMLGGFIGACFAVYRAAPKNQKKSVMGYLISVLIPCVVVGVTEGVEFMYVWTAKKLWAFSALMAGLNYMTLSLLNVHIAKSFSAGLMDFTIYGIAPSATQGFHTNWILVLPVMVVNFIIYFYVFKLSIKHGAKVVASAPVEALTNDQIANTLPALLGGTHNIQVIDSCATRLRLTLVDLELALVNESAILETGAKGRIVRAGGNAIHIIYGDNAQTIERLMNKDM